MIGMKSLQQKLIVFVILPIVVILISIGVAGFFISVMACPAGGKSSLSFKWRELPSACKPG
jgi:hypothetical protein